MYILIPILAIFGLAFFIKESDGPWGLMALVRNKLFKNPAVGVFFMKLLDCYFCLGFHCGWFIYLLYADRWNLFLLPVWGLAGGVISLIMDLFLTRLSALTVPPVKEQPAPRKRTPKTDKVKDA